MWHLPKDPSGTAICSNALAAFCWITTFESSKSLRSKWNILGNCGPQPILTKCCLITLPNRNQHSARTMMATFSFYFENLTSNYTAVEARREEHKLTYFYRLHAIRNNPRFGIIVEWCCNIIVAHQKNLFFRIRFEINDFVQTFYSC